MANTYTQIHLQLVFAVKNRVSLIQQTWKSELYRYISGIIQHQGHKLLAINGMPDHIHILIGMRPDQPLSALLQFIKRDSSKWINTKRFVMGQFEWQEGYGAFSYSKSHIPNVIHYIEQQELHHKKKTFREEYIEFLEKFEIDYNEQYILKNVE
ncbi:MAG: IS200/IS605 family transposase [Filimonas sp.]|nr:IS200/IS605 family transposase [Filimonas sp.]